MTGVLSRLSAWSGIKRQELPDVIAAFLLFFSVLTGYFAVRPIRETIGTILGAERVASLFIVTWVASIALIPAYGALCSRYRRQTFLPWIYGGVAVFLALCGVAFHHNENLPWVGATYYVLISVLNLFITSVFWSFMLEMFDAGQAKRLFGVIAAGGTVGAVTGPVMTGLLVGTVGDAGVLFFGAGMFCVAIVCQRVLIRQWKSGSASTSANDIPIGGNPFAGFGLVLKSPYLIGIALYVVLQASVTTFLYFEQLRLVKETFEDNAARTRIFSQMDAIVQVLTILCQFFFTGRLASKLGVGMLLIAVPVMTVGGLVALYVLHTFMALAVVSIARRVGEYAFVRPGRELLFSPLDTEIKYKAKSLIDVPIYRGGDALVANLTTAISSIGWSPALVGAIASVLWAAMGGWLTRRKELAGL